VAEDRGNSYAHVVVVPPDDDDDELLRWLTVAEVKSTLEL